MHDYDMEAEIEKLIRMVNVAYCAGIVDGEGCLFVHRNPKIGTSIHLIVSMSDQAAVAFVQRTFNLGRVALQNRQGKLHYRWVVCSDNAAKAVREMLPFLKGKREQAELFLGYYEEWKSGQYQKHGRRYDLLDAIEVRIKELRKVPFTYGGPPATTECEDSLETERCDSLDSSGNEPGESAEMTDRLN